MADGELRRFYLALALWVGAFLLGLALNGAGVIRASTEALVFSFVMGLVAVFVFFRPPRA